MAAGDFNRPTFIDRTFNRVFGWFIARGLAPSNFYLLEVRGRKTGQIRTLPVDILKLDGAIYLVAPRGNTQWVRNVRASGSVNLRQGSSSEPYSVREIADQAKPAILKAYLETYRGQVQRFFPVPAGSPVEAFIPLAARYPCFEVRRQRA